MIIGDNNNGRITLSNLDGSKFKTISNTYQSYYDADLDTINKKVYMAWYYGIYSMNYDGSNFDTIITGTDGYSEGIAVDMVNNHVYWTNNVYNTNHHYIYRSNLDGTNIIPFLHFEGNMYLADIEVDASQNKLFFSSWIYSQASGLYSVDLSENNLDTLLQTEVRNIELDNANQYIYYNTASNSVGTKRINYNGLNDTLINNHYGSGYFLDTYTNELYMTTNDNVLKYNLNTNQETYIFQNNLLESPYTPLLIKTTVYDVILNANNANFGTLTGGGIYDPQDTVTIIAQANSGYEFIRWVENGTEISTDSIYTFIAQSNKNITGEFVLKSGLSTDNINAINLKVYPNPTS